MIVCRGEGQGSRHNREESSQWFLDHIFWEILSLSWLSEALVEPRPHPHPHPHPWKTYAFSSAFQDPLKQGYRRPSYCQKYTQTEQGTVYILGHALLHTF